MFCNTKKVANSTRSRSAPSTLRHNRDTATGVGLDFGDLIATSANDQPDHGIRHRELLRRQVFAAEDVVHRALRIWRPVLRVKLRCSTCSEIFHATFSLLDVDNFKIVRKITQKVISKWDLRDTVGIYNIGYII